jgi:glycosyltransferase involved in cell wall biosynthesis
MKTRILNFGSQALGCADGYGNSAEQIVMALERRGIRIILDWTVRPVGHVRADVWDREYEEGDARLYFADPALWDRRTKEPLYGFTMYECDKLPSRWFSRMENVDELWVPSTWNQQIFAEQTGRDVQLIPLGVNAFDFPAVNRKRGKSLKILTFSTQAAETRKGTDIAIRAFTAAFGKRKDVSLTIRSTWECPLETTDRRISLDTGVLETESLANFYAGFDALLFPSRSEGFGLIPLEFMATGGPAIFADATGMHDYAEYGLTVSSHRAPAYIGMGRGSTHQEPEGFWYEPTFDEIVDRLRQVDTDYAATQARAYANAARIGEKWSWERTADAICARLEYRLGR